MNTLLELSKETGLREQSILESILAFKEAGEAVQDILDMKLPSKDSDPDCFEIRQDIVQYLQFLINSSPVSNTNLTP